jgi:COMPASS component SWD1
VIDENAEIDIETCEKNSVFSDVEDSVDEIVFLPAVPSPDAPDEQPEKCLGSSSKLEDSNHSGSPSSMDAVQNGQAIPQASSPMEGIASLFCNVICFDSLQLLIYSPCAYVLFSNWTTLAACFICIFI